MMDTRASSCTPRAAAILAIGLAAIVSWPLSARPQPTVNRAPAHPFIRNATWLLDQPVENRSGEMLGAVTDFAINPNTGRIEFLAIGPGAGKALPTQALEPIPNDGKLVVAISLDEWEEAPEIPRDQLTGLSNEEARREIYEFYDVEYPAAEASQRLEYGQAQRGDTQRSRATTEWARRGDPDNARFLNPLDFTSRDRQPVVETRPALRDPRLRLGARATHQTQLKNDDTPAIEFGAPPAPRHASAEHPLQWASHLIGNRARDRNQAPVGEVSDFILNLRSGRVQHIILSYGGQQFAIPMRVARINENGTVTVHPTAEALQRAPRYDPRQATMRPRQPFLFTKAPEPEFRAPGRQSAGTQTNVGSDRAPEVRREARDRPAQRSE